MKDYLKIKNKENLEIKQCLPQNCLKIIEFKYLSCINNKTKFFISIKNFNHMNNENKQNQENTIKKIRNPGIDLIRIIAMYFIIVNHFIFHGCGFKYFPKYKRKLSLLHCFTDWHIDSFILISGIVGYKTNKYSNLFYLWLTVLFYSVGIHLYVICFKKDFVINSDIYKEYFPIIFQRYWFFTVYFGMYLFLPVLNKGIKYLSKLEFRLVVTSTLGIFIFWKDYKNPKNDIFFLKSGNSVIWFLIFYLTGAYIGKYRIDYIGIKKYIYCIICLFIFFFFSYLSFKSYNNELSFRIGNSKVDFPISLKQIINDNHNSSIKIIQSITVCLFFLQIHYNKYIAKIICFLGPLVFGIYLVHEHNLIRENVIKHIFDNHQNSGKELLNLLLLKALLIFILSIIIDYFRHLLFSLLRLKNFSIFIERKMKEKLS